LATCILESGLTISCRTLASGERSAWDAFVYAHPEGSPFHLMAWRDTIETIFNYRPEYMVAREGSRIVGVLPLFLIDNFVTGRVLMSTPFAVYGGILAESPAVHDALALHVQQHAVCRSVQYLEMRNGFESQRAGFNLITRSATFTKAVAPLTSDELLKSLPSKTRNLVRKSLKHSFTTRRAENLDGFYGLLLNTYRRHGTPVFSLKFFKTIMAVFGSAVDVREVVIDGKVAAASMNFFFRDQMHTYYAAWADEFRAMVPNTFMYFDHLLWAGQNGYKLFDFGRSKIGTGPYEFKKQWDTVERPLPYEIKLVKRETLPNFSPANPKFAMAIKLWRKIPLEVTRHIGPRFVALFP
jgi:FemAB-related protein (PEP-CTERM system-associated)